MRQKQQIRAIAHKRLEEISEVDEDRIEESSRKSRILYSVSSIEVSQVSASELCESAYQSNRVSNASHRVRELPVETQEIDMAALMK